MLNIINHKCSCGDEFELRPSLILRGSKCIECGSKIFSHNKYLEQLKEKNIPIIPLEEWTSNIKKILHKCSCGNEWMSKPNNILQGKRCGCRNTFHNEKYYKDKEAILYSIKLDDSLYKIGLTLFRESVEWSIKKRFSKELGQGIKVELLDYIQGEGQKKYRLEQRILNSSKKYIVSENQYILKNGNTELRTKLIDLNKYK